MHSLDKIKAKMFQKKAKVYVSDAPITFRRFSARVGNQDVPSGCSPEIIYLLVQLLVSSINDICRNSVEYIDNGGCNPLFFVTAVIYDRLDAAAAAVAPCAAC